MVHERPDAPSPPWTADEGRSTRKLARASVINGKMGEHRSSAPADLVPDTSVLQGTKLVQRWEIAPYREEGVLVVCRYAGTDAVLVAEVSASVGSCELRMDWDVKAERPKPGGEAATLVCK